jgi:hypothetical protein
VPRHGSGRPLHLSQLGSTPHDRVTSPQIRSSHSLPLDRPRQDASRHPPVVTNRPTTYRVRREPPLIQQPIHHPPACSSASTPFTHFIRGTQIPIAQDATPTSPSRGFLPWRFAYAGPPVHAAPPSWVRHPQTFTQADSCTAAQKAAATRSLRGTLVLFLIGMCNVPRSNIAFEVTTPLREWSHIGKRSSARH